MKKYKTWEAIKMLTENPKLKFKLVGEETGELAASGVLTADGTELRAGYLYYANEIKHPHTVIGEISIEDEWELVPQAVPFIEAIKAHDYCKTIYCFIDGCKMIYSQQKLDDQNGTAISTKEILKGRWYIKED